MFPFMWTFGLFLVFINVISCYYEYSIEPFFRSDYQFVEQAGGWIKFHRVPTIWVKARTRCQLEGASLMSPSNHDLLGGMMSVLNNTKSAHCGVYTGIHSLFVEGEFHSLEGVPLSQIPVDVDIDFCGVDLDKCMALLPSGYLRSVECDDFYPYMCYRKLTGFKFNQCGTSDQDYHYEPKTRSCYKFHIGPQTWSKAFSICSSEGGHLAIINSPEEAEVLRNIFQQYPPDLFDSEFSETVFVGFLKWTATWSTIHGQTLPQSGYSVFSKGEPNNARGDEFCGAMGRNGGLYDEPCSRKLAYICEKTIEETKGKASFVTMPR